MTPFRRPRDQKKRPALGIGMYLHPNEEVSVLGQHEINMAANEDWRSTAFRQKVISQMYVFKLKPIKMRTYLILSYVTYCSHSSKQPELSNL